MWWKELKSILCYNLRDNFYKMMYCWYTVWDQKKITKMYKGTSYQHWNTLSFERPEKCGFLHQILIWILNNGSMFWISMFSIWIFNIRECCTKKCYLLKLYTTVIKIRLCLLYVFIYSICIATHLNQWLF